MGTVGQCLYVKYRTSTFRRLSKLANKLLQCAAMSAQVVVTSPSATCHIFTFKEGLLSSVAHDLKLVVDKCVIELTKADSSDSPDAVTAVSASFDPRSIRVVCAQRDGRDQPGSLSADHRAEIERHIQQDVLHTDRYAEIRFASTSVTKQGSGFAVNGELLLHGQRRTLTVHGTLQDGHFRSEVRLHQPDFGIKPFSAALGTLRVKADLLVSLSVKVS